MALTANPQIKKTTIEATIIRADGTRVPLGEIASTEKKKSIFDFIKKIGGK